MALLFLLSRSVLAHDAYLFVYMQALPVLTVWSAMPNMVRF